MDKKPSDILATEADEQSAAESVPAQRGTIGDIMTPAPVGVYYSQTIGEAARIMRDTDVGIVLVVRDGQFAGVATDRDLVVRGLAQGAGADDPVGPLCSSELIGVAADADVAQAEQLMRENTVRRLPVLSDGQVVGIVSLGDLAVSTDADSPLAAVSRAQPNT